MSRKAIKNIIIQTIFRNLQKTKDPYIEYYINIKDNLKEKKIK